MRHAALWGLLLLVLSPCVGSAADVSSVSVSIEITSTTVPIERSTVTAPGELSGIRYERLNVFDPNIPGEDWWPFRLANRVHIKTREAVVKRELLLAPGEPWQPLRGLESERNLRSLGLFRRAEIRPETRPDGKQDLVVRTQDSWTTLLLFSAGTEGGEHFLSYGAEEGNVLGYGKSVTFNHSEKGKRRVTQWSYDDARLLGSRVRLSPFYSRTNHGDSIGVSAIRPFFSLNTPFAMGAAWERTVDEAVLFEGGLEKTKFLQRTRQVFGGYGVRLEPDYYFVQRLEAGWWAQADDFNATDDTVPGTLPVARELSGPMFGYSWVQPRYIKEINIDRMDRVEDYNMGNELSVNAGYMAEALGSDRDRLIYRVMNQQGLYVKPGRFALAQVGFAGRALDSNWDNALFFANLNVFFKADFALPQTWVGHLEANSGKRLDGENQVLLGGDTGLRGYKNNSFAGARSVLLNLEDRIFFPGEFFHLVRFGGAVFFDSGAVVPEGSGFSFKRFNSDVGVGLRMSSTRSESGNVVRFDVAYALNDGPGRDRFVVSVKGRQAFQIFNSSTRKVRQAPGSQLNMRPPP